MTFEPDYPYQTLRFGKQNVDWQQRIDMDKLRNDRIARAHAMLHKWGIGAAMIYNWDSGRYLSRPFHHPYGKHLPHHFILMIRDAGFPYYPIGGNRLQLRMSQAR